MKSNVKCFENESQRRNEKGNPTPAGKKQTLTKIERDMRKQGGGGALNRAAARLFWHGRLYLCQPKHKYGLRQQTAHRHLKNRKLEFGTLKL